MAGSGADKAHAFDPFTMEALLLCPSCNASIQPSPENFSAYLSSGGELKCPSCASDLDWWGLILDAIRAGFLGIQYAAVRAKSTIAQIEMTPNEQVNLDLTELGLPATARILDVNYTPAETVPKDAEGFLMPLEMHSNTPDRKVRVDRPLMLYPKPIGESLPETQKVTVMLVWIDSATLSVAEMSLLTAVEALNGGRHHEAVVPAAAAVEVSLGPVLSAFFEGFSNARAVGELLRRTGLATQIDTLLPVVCGVVGAPQLPDAPAEAMRELRKLRNKAAHDGHLPDGTTRARVAKAVAGAVFTIEFVGLVNQHVAEYLEA